MLEIHQLYVLHFALFDGNSENKFFKEKKILQITLVTKYICVYVYQYKYMYVYADTYNIYFLQISKYEFHLVEYYLP